jgi:hypothetical protein
MLHYNATPKNLCKLIFVLQSIRDYHLPLESLFKTITDKTKDPIQRRYTTMINAAVRKIALPMGCEVIPKSEDSRNDVSDEDLADDGVLEDESALDYRIKKWLSPARRQPPGSQQTDPSGSQQTDPSGSQQPNAPDSPRYFESTNDLRFQLYQNMKLFILLHALSLASRGESVRRQWRKAAAEMLTTLDIERFTLCHGVILSLFLRRQNQVTNMDVG